MHKIPMPNNGRDMARLLKANGFTVQLGSRGHYKATHPDYPDKPAIRFSSTPSEGRWASNTLAWIKRTYQLTLSRK